LLGEVDGKGYRKALEDRVIEPLGLAVTLLRQARMP
jgi:hypothetical protein